MDREGEGAAAQDREGRGGAEQKGEGRGRTERGGAGREMGCDYEIVTCPDPHEKNEWTGNIAASNFFCR